MSKIDDDENSGPVIGSGDFLADRGYADPRGMRLKILMANKIGHILEERHLTQRQAAELTGLAQADISRISNRLVKDYSLERLMRALTALGYDVSVNWSASGQEHGNLHVGCAEASDEPAFAMS